MKRLFNNNFGGNFPELWENLGGGGSLRKVLQRLDGVCEGVEKRLLK